MIDGVRESMNNRLLRMNNGHWLGTMEDRGLREGEKEAGWRPEDED